MNYKRILSTRFDIEIKSQKMVYKKLESSYIVLFKWKDGMGYMAPYKCIPSQMNQLDEIDTYVNHNFKIVNKCKEYYLFCSKKQEVNHPEMTIRELNYNDEALLEEMKKECNEADVNEAQIMIDDIHVLGAFIDDKLVGVCSILEMWNAYDIGVLVHPKYRKRDVALNLVKSNANWVLTQDRICIYRCDVENIGSYKTGLKAGFKKEVDIVEYKYEK